MSNKTNYHETVKWSTVLFFLLCFSFIPVFGNTYYVSPDGNSSNPGSSFSNAMDLQTAVNAAEAGDNILLQSGTYSIPYSAGNKNTINISKSGTANNPILVECVNDGIAVFDFSFPDLDWVQDSYGFYVTGSYWYFKGISITRAGYQGVYVTGAHNTFENCAFYKNRNTGLEINKGGSYTTVINCDSYRNYDPKKLGSMADGFGPKQTQGPGNKFIGCRSWENSDDGFDCFDSPEIVTIENCWTFRNGIDYWNYGGFSGNGNGFKLGGNGKAANNVITNSVSFGNPNKGFDQNNNAGSITVYNCTGYDNGTNFGFGNPVNSGEKHILRNNISYNGDVSISNASQSNNTWNSGFSVSSSDFKSLSTSLATASRNPDGSLPENDLFRLNENSSLIDAGVDVGLPYNGTAPDLGAFETGGSIFYTLTTSIVGQGTLSPSGGSYQEGTSLTVTAIPATGYKFQSWGGDASGFNPSIDIIMNSDKNITAAFIQSSDITITIQENETGVLSYDGTIDNNNAGFTGDGFINTPNASRNGITYEICVPASGTYTLVWRFANGGSTDRTAKVQVNGSDAVSNVSFPSTGAWTTWETNPASSVLLSAGTNQIRLEATNSSGLSNIDYMTVTGDSPQAGSCSSVISVTGVSVSPTSASINVGATTQLTATVAPSDATNKTVTWSSNNTSVATVSSSGVVTAVAAGSATITVTTQDGNKTATSQITVNTVNVPVTGVSVSPTSASVNVGATTQLTATVAPSNATNKSVSWKSNSTSVATVSSSGLVTGVADGTATITVTAADGGYTATSNITVSTSSLPTPLIKLGFDDNSGSGVANTGSVSASFSKTDPPSWSSNVPTNGGTSSVDFGTSTGNYYVESASTISELAGMTSFTVTGWVNCKSSSTGSGGNRIVSWINNGGNGVDIVYNSDGSLTVGINQWPDNSSAQSSIGKILTDASAPASNWRFFAVTYDASSSNLSFYFGDNSTAASLDKTISYNQGAVGSSIGKLAIGHFNAESKRTSRTDRMFRGLIDQVQIFGTVLSASEIQSAQSVQSTPVSVTGVAVSPTSLNLTLGDPCANNSTGTLSATVSPSNATNKNVTWTTSNSSVATVDNSGIVTAVGNGPAIITVTTEDGNKTATCNVNVSTVVPVYSVSISPASVTLDAGSTTQLTATVLPACLSQDVSWSSSNTSVATVSPAGLVTGVAAGSATITATTQDGGYTATCNVTVTPVTDVTITLQENEDGFCSVDGSVDNNNAGFTGTGFANTDNSSGTGITWSVDVPSSGTYSLVWRYAHGKTGDRTGQLMVDGSTVVSSVSMQPTGSWTMWTETSATDVSLSAGTHTIRLEATNADGLANIDYLKITGSSPAPVSCTGLKSAVEVNQIAENGLKLDASLYPVPVNGLLYVKFNQELTQPVRIQIFDASGKLAKTDVTGEQVHVMDMSGLSQGLYIIKMSNKDINLIKHITK